MPCEVPRSRKAKSVYVLLSLVVLHAHSDRHRFPGTLKAEGHCHQTLVTTCRNRRREAYVFGHQAARDVKVGARQECESSDFVPSSTHNTRKKGAATKTAPPGSDECLDRKHRDDSVTAIDDDDLVVDHKVHMSTPFRVDLDQRGGHCDNAYARRYGGPNAYVEVDIGGSRTLGDHGVADRRALLSGQGLRPLRILSLAP
jgi:hypothetical protein